MRSRAVLVSLGALLLMGTSPPALPPPSLDALFPGGRLRQSIDELLKSHPLEKGKTFQVTEVGRDANSSHHLVWIADREQPHRHDQHDLFVVVLRGWGTMRIGAETKPLGPGSLVYVPRATPHAFANESPEPAAAYAIYFPPFDGKDRQPVE
jgi:mannose-6-phosphate isomerase-like protein (cupin superfamily)